MGMLKNRQQRYVTDKKGPRRKKKLKMVSTKGIFDALGVGPEEAMSIMRDLYRDVERLSAEDELKTILEKPTLTPEEIWSIRAPAFYAWRRKYDYPRILEHFSKKLPEFEQWKHEYNIDNEMLMRFGISNVLAKKAEKDINKYIIERTSEDGSSTFLSYLNIDGKVTQTWGKPETNKLVKKFISYPDWCLLKGVKFPGKGGRFIDFPVTSSYDTEEVRISILDGLDLLKVGGIEITPEKFGYVLNVKNFEFVNASYLKFKGSIATAGHILRFNNSFVNNLICDRLEFPLVEFFDSQMTNLKITDSRIQQWSFYRTVVSGKIKDSRLDNIRITGGGFYPILDNTYISDVHATHIDELDFRTTYQALKKTYASQGDDANAVRYFLREKDIEREALCKSVLDQKVRYPFKITKFQRAVKLGNQMLLAALRYTASAINNFYWGYGRKPFRVIGISFIIIFLCALVYLIGQGNMKMPEGQSSINFWDSIYYSAVTFTTLGYGDFTPLGYLRVVAASEAIFGGISFGFIVAGFANFKY